LCVDFLQILSNATTSTVTEWEVISDCVAVENDTTVYKIFDNRFHPTYRKPANWVSSPTTPWLSQLNVTTHFEYVEDITVTSSDVIGEPNRKRQRDQDDGGIVPYPKGSVKVISYDFQVGTHTASKVSDFKHIADTIKLMHAANKVHADIRGFNMLHPPRDGSSGAIQNSILLDFDLSGDSGTDKYPPGFNPSIRDNAYLREGEPGKLLEKSHDWIELASAMATHEPVLLAHKRTWELLVLSFELNTITATNASAFADAIEEFISDHGDLQLDISLIAKSQIARVLRKAKRGTGSPNKQQQKSRGKSQIED
jgi:hypothetical protein